MGPASVPAAGHQQGRMGGEVPSTISSSQLFVHGYAGHFHAHMHLVDSYKNR